MTSYQYDETMLADTSPGDIYYLKAFMEYARTPHFE